MTTRNPVLLLDDGELDDVRALLEEFGEPFVHLRGAEIPIRVEEPSRLLIATSRRAVLARGWPGTPGEASPEKVAVVTEDSNTLRSMLRRIGFHLMIRRPVHPYALRLVLLRALYRGSERRRDVRLPFGCEISVRSGLRRRSATLAELSTRGCRLLSNHVFGVGTRVTLQLPPEVAGGRGLALRAKVLRTRAEGDGCRAVVLSFVDVDASARAQLSQLLKERAEGPVKLAQRQASAARPLLTRPASDPKCTIALPPAPSGNEERRKHRRAPFREQVMTLGERASLILMGRDISAGGMRVDFQAGLEEGAGLRLAIYGRMNDQPLLVRARVVRDDGACGMGLVFEDASSDVAARLEAMVASLPCVEELDGEAEAMGSVVSEILEFERA